MNESLKLYYTKQDSGVLIWSNRCKFSNFSILQGDINVSSKSLVFFPILSAFPRNRGKSFPSEPNYRRKISCFGSILYMILFFPRHLLLETLGRDGFYTSPYNKRTRFGILTRGELSYIPQITARWNMLRLIRTDDRAL